MEIVKLVRSGNLNIIRQLVDELIIDVNTVLPVSLQCSYSNLSTDVVFSQDEWTILGLSIEFEQSNITKYLLAKFHDPRNPVDLESRNQV